MKKISMKLRYFAAGFLVAAILSTGIVTFASPEMRQLFFGVTVVFNGEALELDGIDRPFIIDGRTFLPAAVIAEMLGIPVQWDPETTTVYLGINSPLLGRWEVIGMGGMTEEEFLEDIYLHGPIEIVFLADGTLKIVEDDWTEILAWTSEDGVVALIYDFGWDVDIEYADYYIYGDYLTIISHDFPEEYLLLRRIH